jgi:hypothetical protein
MCDEENRRVADWKRVRSVIEHENTLINHRVTWLLASQGFLFAGYSALITGWAKGDLHIARGMFVALLFALFAISAYVCISMGIMLSAAIRHIKRIQCWWYKIDISAKPEEIQKVSDSSELNTLHPHLQGWKARKHTRPFDTEFMPYFFLGGWIILLFIGIVVASPAFWTKFPNQLTRILTVVGVFAAAVTCAVIGYFYGKGSADDSLPASAVLRFKELVQKIFGGTR